MQREKERQNRCFWRSQTFVYFRSGENITSEGKRGAAVFNFESQNIDPCICSCKLSFLCLQGDSVQDGWCALTPQYSRSPYPGAAHCHSSTHKISYSSHTSVSQSLLYALVLLILTISRCCSQPDVHPLVQIKTVSKSCLESPLSPLTHLIPVLFIVTPTTFSQAMLTLSSTVNPLVLIASLSPSILKSLYSP